MGHPAPNRTEIIRLVEMSHLPVRRTLKTLGISRATSYRWIDLCQTGGPEALYDPRPRSTSAPDTQGSERGPWPRCDRECSVNERWHQTLKKLHPDRGDCQTKPRS